MRVCCGAVLPEAALCVDVGDLAGTCCMREFQHHARCKQIQTSTRCLQLQRMLTPAVGADLGGHAKRVTQLGLACAPFPKNFSDLRNITANGALNARWCLQVCNA